MRRNLCGIPNRRSPPHSQNDSLSEEPEVWGQGSCSENVTRPPEDPAVANTMPNIPFASTKTTPGELPPQGQVSRRAFLRDPQNPLKSPESGLTGSEQSER